MAELSPDELNQIASVFKELNVKPKADSAQDFKQWMTQYVTQMNEEEFVNVKTEQQTEIVKSAASGSNTSSYIPKIDPCYSLN